MLRIINAKGLMLELNPGDKITIDWVNPLFNEPNELYQDEGYPGTAPFSENNHRFFENGHLIETETRWYIQQVWVNTEESLQVVGNIRYRVNNEAYDFNLEPNISAMSDTLKIAMMTDMRTMDSDIVGGPGFDIEAIMLESVQHPELYHYAFIPVKNPNSGPDRNEYGSGWINSFDRTSQQFVSAAGSQYDPYCNTPFIKLAYMLKKIAEFLGFVPAGSLFTDPEFNKIYIFSRLAWRFWRYYTSARYMPYMKVADFLKAAREEFHLAIYFDLVAGTMTVESFETIRTSNDAFDLTPYIIKGYEQQTPDIKGYKVTRKVDETDQAFAVEENGETTYPAPFTLYVGDGGNEVSLESGTLKTVDESADGIIAPRYPMVDQIMLNTSFNITPGVTGQNFPPDDPMNHASANKWPLRFFKYLGWQQMTDGSYFPCAEGVNFSQPDFNWYQFRNDGKPIIYQFKMQASIFAGLKRIGKFCTRSAGGNYVYFLLEKISYDFGDSDFVEGKMYVRLLNYAATTPVKVVDNLASETHSTQDWWNLTSEFRFKAYFNQFNQGIQQLKVFCLAKFNQDYDPELPEYSYLTELPPITQSTSVKGVGGQIIGLPTFTAKIGYEYVDVRIYQGRPKFIERAGLKQDFTWNAGGWYEARLYYIDTGWNDEYWISF